jgi:hypothetical protein
LKRRSYGLILVILKRRKSIEGKGAHGLGKEGEVDYGIGE